MRWQLLFWINLIVLNIAVGQSNAIYKIEGKINNIDLENTYVTLSLIQLAEEVPYKPIDSVLIRGGRFLFSGQAHNNPTLARIKSLDSKVSANVILEPGDIQVIFPDYSQPRLGGLVSGTPMNDYYNQKIVVPNNELRNADSISSRRSVMMKNGTWYREDEAHYMRHLPNEQLIKKLKEQVSFVENYIESPLIIQEVVYNFYRRYRMDQLLNNPSFLPNEEWMEKYIPKFDKALIAKIDKEIAKFPDIIKRINMDSLPKVKERVADNVRQGQPFIDFSSVTSDGKKIKLSEILETNKVVILDFWATWCGPCMAEMPKIADLYKNYKDNGLEIIGISLDKDSEKWKRKISDLNMNWIQIRRDEICDPGTLYDIQVIPYTILINRAGEILYRDLRGDQLSQTIQKLLSDD